MSAFTNVHNRLKSILQDLQLIADQNNGTRAVGTPGYEASVDYVLEHTKNEEGYNPMHTLVDEFYLPYNEVGRLKLTGPEGYDVPVLIGNYNKPIPAGGIKALLNSPMGSDMCRPDDWKNYNLTGKIVLLERGGCVTATKFRRAKDAGAVGTFNPTKPDGIPR